MAVSDTTGNNTGDIDGRILLPSTHNVETEALLGFWQFDNSWVSMAFACGESSNGRLKEKQVLLASEKSRDMICKWNYRL